MKAPDLMIFEPNLGGHHAEFTCHLLHFWLNTVPEGRLLAAVAPGLLEQQAALSAGAIDPPRTSLAVLAGPLPGGAKGLLRKGRRNQRLLKDAIERHRPRNVLVMYLDQAQLALAMGLRFPFPVRISGILFHPTLHYSRERTLNPMVHLQRLRKRLMLAMMARNPHLGTVFTLDGSAVPSLRRMGLDAVALPDPVIPSETDGRTADEVRRHHKLEEGRRVLLLFGALTARKGIIPLLQAIALLPPAAARKTALLMAGPLDPSLSARVEHLSSIARSAGVQVVHHDAYIQNGAAQALMRASDLVLAPYQRHFGSSAVLIRAAMAGRPVLSQDFGLMASNVREFRLGQCVDTGEPTAIAEGIESFLENPSPGFDPEYSQRFVQNNTPELFCRTILSHLQPDFQQEPNIRLYS